MLLCVAFVLSRNLKKAVTFLRQKRRTGHKCFLAHHTYPIFTHQLVCTVICDKLPWGRFAIFRCFRWVWVLGGCVCWVSVCLWGFGCFAPCLGSLRCLIVSSCSPWVFSVAHRRSIPTAFGLTVKALFCLRVHLISPSAGGTGRRY